MPSITEIEAGRRKDFAEGLRKLAEAIEADAIPLPSKLVYGDVNFYAQSEAEFLAITGLLTYVRHEISGGPVARLRFLFFGTVAGLTVSVHGDPAWVCDREVVGTVENVRWTFRGQPVAVSA